MPHYRRIECGAVERAGSSRDFDATQYTWWSDGHGMAAASSHCILASFTVLAKTQPQSWAAAAGYSQQGCRMLFDWGSEGSRLQQPRHTWLQAECDWPSLAWAYASMKLPVFKKKNEQRWKGSTWAMCSAFVAMMVPWTWMDGWWMDPCTWEALLFCLWTLTTQSTSRQCPSYIHATSSDTKHEISFF